MKPENNQKLNKFERRDAEKFILLHGCDPEKAEYRYTPASIGIRIDIICACGLSRNITDYNSW